MTSHRPPRDDACSLLVNSFSNEHGNRICMSNASWQVRLEAPITSDPSHSHIRHSSEISPHVARPAAEVGRAGQALPPSSSDTQVFSMSSSKRKTVSRVAYPRKRALMACETCRKRKSKCDNSRPTCGKCKELEVECNWRDLKSDYSSYDLASLEILERINYVADLLESQTENLSGLVTGPQIATAQSSFTTDASPSRHSLQLHPTPQSIQFLEDAFASDNIQGDAEILLESLEIAGRSSGNSEDVLDWPVFEGRYHRANIEALILNPQSATSQRGSPTESNLPVQIDPVRSSKSGRGVQEEDVKNLVEKFLRNVHIKNPVLEADDLKQKAKRIQENGFEWDAASCLVLIACGLASLSSTFAPEYIRPSLVEGPNAVSSVSDAHDYPTAEAYYIAAQKRIGLLENSVLTTQCCFLSGVYEMYSLRPLRAWASFNRACITLQIYFKSQIQQVTYASKGVERRLYWSCLKSECEIRMEVDLPASGLAKFSYPDVFPTPPSGSPEPSSDPPEASLSHRLEFSARRLEPGLEKSWSYYVSEIAVRRIGNRLMNSLYTDGENGWLSMPLDRMIRIAEELDLQLTQWYNHLPSSLAKTEGLELHDDTDDTKELNHVLQVRLFDFRERIYRPFLYLAMHHSSAHPIQQNLAPYVQRCLDACLTSVLRGCLRHRHHGTWYANRQQFLMSLLLIAAVKSGKVHAPDGWREGIGNCVACLKFWEEEAPDLRESRLMLQSLLDEVDADDQRGSL